MTSEHPEDMIRALEATPGWLADALAAADKGPGEAPRVGGEWGLADIIRHLRASDAILAPRILQVLIRPGVALAAFDERAWAELTSAAEAPLSEQLGEFASRRSELVGVLRSLSYDQWQLSGEHEVRGTMTVAQIAASIVEHETEHRAQADALIRATQSS